MLNYPSQSICLGNLAARNYLQLHLLVALCLLVVGTCRPPLPLALCDKHGPSRQRRLAGVSRSFFLHPLSLVTLILPTSIKQACFQLDIASVRRSLGSIGRLGAASVHRVDDALVLGHVIVCLGLQHALRGVPDENGTLGASSHDELLIG